jgi:hypothetical protein
VNDASALLEKAAAQVQEDWWAAGAVRTARQAVQDRWWCGGREAAAP